MNSIEQAVILVGGKGTRLLPLTLKTPKPMILINGKPFLEYIIQNLKENKIKRIILLTGYLHEQFEHYFKDGKKFGVLISYSFSSVNAETGTRIRNAKQYLDDEFLLLYGDNYWPLKLHELYASFKKKKTLASMSIYLNKDNYSKNNVYVNKKGLVEIYEKKGKSSKLNGVDMGFFILKKSILNDFPKYNFSFEEVMLPKLISESQLSGFLTDRKYYGLSNLDRIPGIEKYFKKFK